jgi:hypothetical protein
MVLAARGCTAGAFDSLETAADRRPAPAAFANLEQESDRLAELHAQLRAEAAGKVRPLPRTAASAAICSVRRRAPPPTGLAPLAPAQQLPVPEPAHPTPLTSSAPRGGKGLGLSAASIVGLFAKKQAAKQAAPSKPATSAAAAAGRLEFGPLSATAGKALQRTSAQPLLLTAEEPSSAGKSSHGPSARPTWEHPSEEGVLQLIAGGRAWGFRGLRRACGLVLQGPAAGHHRCRRPPPAAAALATLAQRQPPKQLTSPPPGPARDRRPTDVDAPGGAAGVALCCA